MDFLIVATLVTLSTALGTLSARLMLASLFTAMMQSAVARPRVAADTPRQS